MGVQITELFEKEKISLNSLNNKKIVVDTYNQLYQFLTTIRQPDGTPLMDSKGRITSHLTGLFSRTARLLQNGIKLAFVFDGKPPKLKKEERDRRKNLKLEAEKKYKIAVKKRDVIEMKKYAARTSRLDNEMIEDSKKLITAFGLPIIQAPSEGEAQAAYMVRKGEFFAVASQDTDSLIFGAYKLVRNLSITGRRKHTGQNYYEEAKPEIIELSKNIKKLGINQDQLIVLAMLVGTDFNVRGIKGIGPKNALKLVKQFGSDFAPLFKEVNWNKYFGFSWKKVYDLIKNMPTTDNYKIEWKAPDDNKIIKLLVDEHDFSEERITKTLDNLSKEKEKQKQKGLGDFF